VRSGIGVIAPSVFLEKTIPKITSVLASAEEFKEDAKSYYK
jgi:hypothetical protein